MSIQRLAIHAPAGKLRIISIWRTLAASHASVCGWTVSVDSAHGVECMTVDVRDCAADRITDIVDSLNRAPLEMNVTAYTLLLRGQHGAARPGN